MLSAGAYVRGLEAKWQNETGGRSNVPGYLPVDRDLLRDQLLANPFSGQVPKGSDDRLLAVGKPKPTKENRPDWMTDEQAQEPMTRKQVDYWRGWLKDHPDDPNAQGVREQLGIVP